MGENGTFIIHTNYTRLINDWEGNMMGATLDGAPEIGAGRVLLLGDVDMFTDTYQTQFPEDVTFANNVVSWALQSAHAVTGSVTLDLTVGSPWQEPVHFDFLVGNNVVWSTDIQLAQDGTYWFCAPVSGPVNIRAKADRYLSILEQNVTLQGDTILNNIEFPFCGDASGDNKVNLLDLSMVLSDFMQTGNDPADLDRSSQVSLPDLSIVLSNYNMAGQ